MTDREYLLSYGIVGDFGRFRSSQPLECRRGDRLLIRSHRGQEIGVVLRPANAGHSRLLEDRFIGEILRPAGAGDLELAQRMQQRGRHLFEDSQRITTKLGLTLVVVDAEVLLDGRQAVIHYLRWADCDPRPLMEPLAQQYRLLVTMHDLALPARGDDEEDEALGGCGAGGCGSNGCGTCQSGNCATCVSHKGKHAPIGNRIGSAETPGIPGRVSLA